MKRSIFAICLVFCIIFASAGFAAEKKITLRFANWGSTEKATSDTFKKMIADFEAKNPTIKIDSVSFPYGDIKQQVLVMSAAGDVLDVVQAERAMVDSYIGSGYVTDVERYFSKSYLNDFYPNILNDLKSGGKIYGIPWIASPWVLVYNKELFTKAGLNPNTPPQNLTQLMDDAGKLSGLKDKDGNSVYGLGETTGNVPISGSSIYRIMLTFGGGIWNKRGQVAINTKGNVDAFRYLKTLYEKKYNPETAKLKDLRNLMAIGRLGMYFDQTWGMGGIYGINPAIKSQLGMAPIPATSVTSGLSDLNAHVLCIMKDSKHKKEAAKFIEFITSKETLVELYKQSPFFAPRMSIDNLPEFHDSMLKGAKAGVKQIVPLAKQNPNYENAYLELVNAAQRVTLAGETPESVVKNLDTKLKTILK
ncbi:MAG TPA: hypothetical protein DDW50_06790 [Firmicutes bacterium]|jgi:multiple sugar transport system substrate-binding protein|nr:hypothetical protein [Bacillota bacterium]